MEYEHELVIRTAGALPVVAKLAAQLGLVEAVDRFCPIRAVADYTHGQVVLALVANRLTHPRPLSSFEEWGEDFAVAETLGIASYKLNDDRLGRTLDALAERLSECSTCSRGGRSSASASRSPSCVSSPAPAPLRADGCRAPSAEGCQRRARNRA